MPKYVCTVKIIINITKELYDTIEFEAPDSETIESIVNYLRNVKEQKEVKYNINLFYFS